MPVTFWDEAFLTATFLINRLPTRVIDNASPLERLLGDKAKQKNSMLKTFGCACFPHLRPYNAKKLTFRSKECVFIGYSANHKGYKCLDPKTGRVYISRDVIFDEQVFPFSRKFEANLSPPDYSQILSNGNDISSANVPSGHVQPCTIFVPAGNQVPATTSGNDRSKSHVDQSPEPSRSMQGHGDNG
jgi:hypothetical protein